MKVLQLSYEIYPVVGGTSTLIQYLIEGLEGTDCQIHLVTKTTDKKHPEVIHVANSKIYTIYSDDAEETSAQKETRTQVQFFRRIMDIVKSGVTFDLIHVHDALPVDLIPFLKKNFNVPIIMNYHINHHILVNQAQLSNDTDIIKNKIALELEKKGAKLCDYYLSASNSTKKWLEDYYNIDENKISVVPYGINLSKYPDEIDCTEARRIMGSEDKKIILFAGRFVLQKGIEYLLEAFEKVLKVIPNAKLVLIGEGKKKDEIVNRLSKLKDDCFVILDKLPFYQLPPYYRSADVVVMPSIFEPFGMVSIEGMASKGNMIISSIDGLSEIVVDKYNGRALPVNVDEKGFRWIDTNLLKNMIIEALTDTKTNNALRENARRQVVDKYSAQKFASGMYEAYKSVIEKWSN